MPLELSACCLKRIDHEGTPVGSHEKLFGLDTYKVGDSQSENCIVIFTDIFGNRYKNTLLVADMLAKLGNFQIFIPDLFNGDAVTTFENLDRSKWLAEHSAKKYMPKVDAYLKNLKESVGPKSLGAIGYCYGAAFVLKNLYEGGLLDSGAVAHPSLVTPLDFGPIRKPLLMSLGEEDDYFPLETRIKVEEALVKSGADFQIILFKGAGHGYAVRGDPNDENVRYAINKTVLDQAKWFARYI